MAENFYVMFTDPSCIGFLRYREANQTDKQTNKQTPAKTLPRDCRGRG